MVSIALGRKSSLSLSHPFFLCSPLSHPDVLDGPGDGPVSVERDEADVEDRRRAE